MNRTIPNFSTVLGGKAMQPSMPIIARSALLLAALSLVAVSLPSGCAQDQDEIDRVQPNKIKKSGLLGKEYFGRQTVVETQFTSGYTFPGAMSSTVRGVFEIQEDTLFFYRTYEFIQGSEAYAMKSDVDRPMLDKAGNPIKHAVLVDYMRLECTPDDQALCGPDAWCADAKSAKLPDEASLHGFCVTEATRFIYRGAPIHAYPIHSHFDVRYDYNASTGEKSNVLVENTTDRKWHEREFMRVHWGAGTALSYEFSVLGGDTVIFEGDTAPEGEKFETGVDHRYGKDVPQGYISFIQREILQAPMIWSPYYGEIPLCYFYPWYSGGVYDCVTEEIKVRTFFLEVPDFSADPDKAYASRKLDDVEFEKFGYFRSERQTYDPQYGKTFDDAIRQTQRHRIWDRYVKKMTKDKDGIERWTGEFDYSQMNPVPIVYYMNDDHPRELVSASINIAKQWSKAFEAVVKHHKPDYTLDHPMFILCENTDAIAQAADDAGQTTAQWSGTTVGGKFCRHMGEPRKFGDLRYSMMHAVVEPIQIGLYGYGPSAADPLTGEIMAGYAHSYVAQMKMGAERAMNTIEFHAGLKDFNDIKYDAEQTWLVKAKSFAQYDTKGPKVAHEQSHVAAPTDTKEAQDYVRGMIEPDVRAGLMAKGLERVDNAGTWAQNRMQILRSNPELDAMMVTGHDHSVHALFKNPDVGKGTAAKVSSSWMDKMSLANWAHTAGLRQREKVRLDLAAKNLYLEEFADAAVLGLANEYGRVFDQKLCEGYVTTDKATVFDWAAIVANTHKDLAGAGCTGADSKPHKVGEFESLGLSRGRVCVDVGEGATWASCSSQELMHQLRLAVADAIGLHPLAEKNHFLPNPLYTDTDDPVVRSSQQIGRGLVLGLRDGVKVELWSRIYEGTQLHEVGHTLGLRHNFEASTDTLNYHKEYWGLKLDASGEIANPWQRDTLAQSMGKIREKQLASVMDYTAKFNGRWAGLGHYDVAAIKFGYGDLVEVFNNPPDMTKAPGAGLKAMNEYLAEPSADKPGDFELLHLGNQNMLKLTRKLHYSTLPKFFGGVDKMYDRTDVAWSTIKGARCTADADCGGAATCVPFGQASYCKQKSIPGTAKALVEVPYRFCSDEYNMRSPTCSTFDEGADPLELARNALDDYENYWFFYGYAWDSETFHTSRYEGSVNRYLYGAHRQFQYWAMSLSHYSKNDWWKTRYGDDYDVDPAGGLSGSLATAATFNTLMQVLARPATGYYCWNSVRKRYEPYAQEEGGALDDCTLFTELDGARQLYAGWSFSGYLTRPVSGGQFYDRLTAFSLLSDPTPPNYVAVNEDEDVRRYLAGYFNFFPRQVMNLLTGISVENADHFGWCVLNGGKLDGQTQRDYLIRPQWVGGKDVNICPADCLYQEDDPNAPPLDKQPGCTKYRMFPDRRPTFPSSRFRMPLLASLYGMTMLVRGFDRSFMDISRIFLKGNQAAIELPDGVTKCTFTDPLSGKVYVAYEAADDVLNAGCIQLGEAQKVLNQTANITTLQDNYLFSEYQFRVSLIDILRTLHETYEY